MKNWRASTAATSSPSAMQERAVIVVVLSSKPIPMMPGRQQRNIWKPHPDAGLQVIAEDRTGGRRR